MEFISGISKKEYVSIKELAQGSCDGKTVRMEGMVHAVRDMGDVRFVILRKAEGLVQCVYEEKTAGFALGELKDESAVRVACQQMETKYFTGSKIKLPSTVP